MRVDAGSGKFAGERIRMVSFCGFSLFRSKKQD